MSSPSDNGPETAGTPPGKPETPPPGPAPSGKAIPRKKAPGGRSSASPEVLGRRKLTWWVFFGFLGVWILASLKFFFPRALFEPSSRFKIGFPGEYGFGVDTKWQQAKRIWVVKDASKLFVILANCTHLGCTPDWKEADAKFKCPCHGSGFTMEGVNFEGPAPRPLQRGKVWRNPQGEIIVDKSSLFERESWDRPDASIPV